MAKQDASSQSPTPPGASTLFAGETLTVYEVAKLKSEWLKSAKEVSDVTLSADQVTEVDAAGLQLLVGLRKWIEQGGRTLTVVSPTSVLVSAFEAAGMQDWLQNLVTDENAVTQ